MVTPKEKLQTKLAKINHGEEGVRKGSVSHTNKVEILPVKRLFGAGLNYKFPINIFIWIYRHLPFVRCPKN